MKHRLILPIRMALATLMAATLVLATGQAPAAASLPSDYKVTTSVILHGSDYSQSYTRMIFIKNGWGETVGTAEFRADPMDGSPGDALGACDELADGLGVEIRMDIGSSSGFYQTDRIASTRGRNSPTCTGWVTGDIAENTPVALKVCLVSGTLEYCTGVYYARS
ncbi:hypothetical protein AB0H57_11470 [Micromonospora sp. NPDC050686]|uniref:hypothetical protein n=1 Tax=Micromonospora sp. NPDC050686 TaxID=3154631 RepID=UPI0033FF3BE8